MYDNLLKRIMIDAGLPESHSLYSNLHQLITEVQHRERERAVEIIKSNNDLYGMKKVIENILW